MNRTQYKLLKRIKKADIYNYSNCTNDKREAISFFAKHGYIVYVSNNDDFTRNPTHLCRISQEGRAALYEWKVDKIYRLVPTYLAIFAAIGGYRKELALIIQVLKKLLKL